MVRLRFESDLGSTIQASQDFAKAVGKVKDAATGSVREMNALEKAAKRLTDQNLTPQEKYNQKLETMAKAVKAGKMSMEDAATTATRLRQKLDDTAKSGGKAFGPNALDSIKGYAAGLFTLQTAVNAVSAALTEMDARRAAAAQRVMDSLGPMGELAQVSETAGEYGTLREAGRNLVRRGISPNTAQGAELAFAMRSAGLAPGEQENVFKLAEQGLIRQEGVLPIARGVGKFRSAFGSQEAGSIEGILDKAMQASKGTSSNLSGVLVGSLEMAQAAKSQGFSDEEALAALVVAEQGSKSIDIAGTQVKALFESAKQKGIAGGTMGDLLGNIEKQMAGGKTAFSVLGRSEAVTAFEQIRSNRGEFDKQLGLIQKADAQNVAARSAGLIASDPLMSEAISTRKKKGSLAVEEEDIQAQAKLRVEGWRANQESRIRQQSWPVELFNRSMNWGFQGVDNITMQDRAEDEIREELKRQTEIMRRDSQGLQAPRPSGRQEQ